MRACPGREMRLEPHLATGITGFFFDGLAGAIGEYREAYGGQLDEFHGGLRHPNAEEHHERTTHQENSHDGQHPDRVQRNENQRGLEDAGEAGGAKKEEDKTTEPADEARNYQT